ncbi:hypothetical protein D3C73_1081950 [compost metagenome]
MSTEPEEFHYAVKGNIITREMLGSETIYQVRSEQDAYMVKCSEDLYAVDQEIYLGVPASKIYFFGEDENRIDEKHHSFRGYLEKLRGITHG